MKKGIIFLLLMGVLLDLFSQTHEQNHEKYWYYRYRMKHYFSAAGPNLYQGLVSARRNSWNGKNIYYGDQTIDMGWYMGALAMEYYLLKPYNNEDELNETLTELYYLMKAFERLDMNEGSPPFEDYPELRDGFFLRKDAEMLNGINEQPVIDQMNYKLGEDDIYGTKPPGHPTFANNLEHGDSDGYHMFHMSQDHLIHLLIGFASVKRSFEFEDISFIDYTTGNTISYNFYQEALLNVDNMVQYARNQGHEHGAWRWFIYTPAGDKVFRGADMRLYSYGLAAAGGMLTGGNYHNSVSNLNYQTWQGFMTFNSDESNTNMELILATIGRSWGPLATDNYIYPKSRYIRQGIYMANLNWDFFYIPFYEYINIVDSPFDTQEGDNRLEKLVIELNNAPTCGPYQYATSGENMYYDYCGDLIPRNSGPGWAHHNRYRRNEAEADGDHEEIGNFPGIDYMITYNLYRALHGGAAYHNMINTYLKQDYPYEQGGEWYGTESNPANLRAFETFECNNEIETNTNGDWSLNLIASNSIKLTPGFHVYQGAHFSAQIEEYDCWAAGGNGSNKSSFFHDNGYVYNYNKKPMDMAMQTDINKPDEHIILNQPPEFKQAKTQSGLLTVYPNPAKNQITIKINSPLFESTPLTIRDIYGNIAITKAEFKGGIIDVSQLSNGVYLVEVSVDGVVYQERLVVL